jgi:hypothetical protein
MAAVLGLALAAPAGASVIYNGPWTSGGGSANYLLTITDTNGDAAGGSLKWSLTINPWTAEALGLFVDLGNFAIPDTFTSAGITNVTTSPNSGGTVTLFAQDTTSSSCGTGCNLNGAPTEPLAVPDSEWELVFRLGGTGFDGIQTWNFTTPDFGAKASDFGLVAIRSQQLCNPGQTLPDGNCPGSQKAFGFPGDGTITTSAVPEPATLGLLSVSLLGLAGLRRKSS